MKYKLVIMDFDGTLMDTIYGLGYSMNKAIEYFGYPKRDIKEYNNYFGNGIYMALKRAMPDEVQKETLDKVYDRALIEYNKYFDLNLKFYDGIPEFLDIVTSKTKVAINSNKQNEMLNNIVNKNLNKWEFCGVHGMTSEVDQKPNPFYANKLIEKYNLKKEEVVYIGDTPVDIQTAKNAKITSIAVTWGFRDKEELEEAKPNYIVDSTEKLLELLQKK